MCDNLDTSHRDLTALYQKVNSLPYIKKAFVSSGVRYDLLFREYNPSAGKAEERYLHELVVNHTSGRLKIAPEHTDDEVLWLMRKSPFRHFRKLREKFQSIVRAAGLKYELIPYFISAHPGTTDQKMAGLARELKELGMHPEQVQDFTPTPMTLATAMYYLGFDPYTGKKVYVARDIAGKRKQKEYFFKSKGKSKENQSRKLKVESRISYHNSKG